MLTLEEFFSKDFTGGEFVFLGKEHLIAMGLLLLLNILIPRLKNVSQRARNLTVWGMVIVLWSNELSWHVWHWFIGEWTINTMLPLHLCSIMIWLSGWMLITRNYTLYEFIYFLGLGAATQAILTPDLGIYGFPHYRFFQTFISHGMLVTTAIYMTTVEGFRPTWKSMLRVIIGTNLYMLFVIAINWLIGSNYMFTMHKPETASLFDIMPGWPWYLVISQGIGLVVFLLLYLPFVIKDWRAGKQQTT